ncbi:MAG: hypothetical protein JNJ61_28580 [Anaerolineae bacterium]|nr:hypothetical protein [Anaerolineae bacterium]
MTTRPLTRNRLFEFALIAVAALLLLASLARLPLPIIDTERAAFFALFIIGFVLCSGYGMQFNTHPINLIGMALGVFIVLLGIALLFNITLPFLPDGRAALLALAALMAVKIGLAALRARLT